MFYVLCLITIPQHLYNNISAFSFFFYFLVSQEIDEVRKEYCQKIALLDINKYKHVRVGEFKSHNYLLPDFLMEKNRSYTPNVTNRASDYYISLNSNLLIAFFQSLLPWYQVDYNG